MPEIPTKIDSDDLPPTQYLILEVLAARHRTGEQLWTFPSRLLPPLRALSQQGLIRINDGVAPRTIRAWLTDEGREAALMDGYKTPIDKERESAYRAGREDEARSSADEPDDDVDQAQAAAAEVIWKQAFEAGKRAGREDSLRWAADRIDPGPRNPAIDAVADAYDNAVSDADRGTATKLRFWADQQRLGEDQDTPEGRT